MNLTLVSSGDLTKLAELIRKKEELLRAAAAIDSELERFSPSQEPRFELERLRGNAEAVMATGANPPGHPYRPGSKRAKLATALQRAGAAGETTATLAELTVSTKPRISVAMAVMKRIGLIRRIGLERYAWIGALGNGSPAHPKPGKVMGRPRGHGPNQLGMIKALEDAGPEGLTTKELATAAGLRPKQVLQGIWRLLRSGRGVEQVSRGVYAWKGER